MSSATRDGRGNTSGDTWRTSIQPHQIATRTMVNTNEPAASTTSRRAENGRRGMAVAVAAVPKCRSTRPASRPSTPYSAPARATASSDAAHSRSARAFCMADTRSTPMPRGAPYHSPKIAPASAAGPARRRPSIVAGTAAGMRTARSSTERDTPWARTTSSPPGGVLTSPM